MKRGGSKRLGEELRIKERELQKKTQDHPLSAKMRMKSIDLIGGGS